MDAHIVRVQTLARDLVEQLQAGDRRAALQTLTALRARCDVIGGELLELPASAQDGNLEPFELSEMIHG